MSETEAQKRHRIEHTERDHSRNPPPSVAQLIPSQLPGDEPTDAPWHVQLACKSKWFTPSVKSNRVVVVHATAAENPASSTAAFFASCTEPSGSTQGIVDNVQGFQSVPDNAVCAGAPPMNTTGLHVEQSGSEGRSRADWLAHIDEIDRLAYKTAEWCKQFSIPIVLLHTADLPPNPADAHGITYHQAISDRYHESTHQDPGPGYPWDVFMAAVQQYAEGDDVTTPAEKAILAQAKAYLDALTKDIGQTKDPTKPASPEGAGHRVARVVNAAETPPPAKGH